MNLYKEIFTRLDVQIEEFELLETNLNELRTKFLFEQKNFNIYREEILLIWIYFNRFKSLIGADVELLERISCLRRSEMVKKLNICAEKSLKFFHIGNVLCLKKSEILLVQIFKLKYLLNLWNVNSSNVENFLILFKENFQNLFFD